jgi:DNA-binding response OmpR family regulator
MNRTILIVEDEADLADTYRRLLDRRGWTAVVVATRRAGLDALQGRPALAIVDRSLPDGDGLEVVQAATAAGTPAIMISGRDWADTRRLALGAGAAGFLGKPFSTRDLLALIDTVTGSPPAGPGPGPAPAGPPPPLATSPLPRPAC